MRIERDHRIRQSRQHVVDQRIAGARGRAFARRQNFRTLLAGCPADQRRGGEHRKARERRKRAERAEDPQTGEHKQSRRQHEPGAP